MALSHSQITTPSGSPHSNVSSPSSLPSLSSDHASDSSSFSEAVASQRSVAISDPERENSEPTFAEPEFAWEEKLFCVF